MQIKILSLVPAGEAGNIVTFYPEQIINVDIEYAKELVKKHFAEYYIPEK